MEAQITLTAGLDEFLIRSANYLGIEINFKTESIRAAHENYLSIVTVKSANTQLAMYPAVEVSNYRDRLAIKPANLNEELLENLLIQVNLSAKSNSHDGVSTYIFSLAGELIEVSESITIESLWSLEFACTSIFENAVRAAHQLPLGKPDLKSKNWLVMNFLAPHNLDMKQPFKHLFAHEPGYRIVKATSHSGYVALQDCEDLFKKVAHAVDYLEGVINE
ncbi:MAG: hypothetical protein RLZZ12_368 [Actinomycetota bacterium]|jgi:5-(carboxyamino)imidazole ribonucleotide synthase